MHRPTLLLSGLWVFACTPPGTVSTDTDPAPFAGTPWTLDATLSAPAEGIGLAARLNVTSSRPCALDIDLDSGDHQRSIVPPTVAEVHDLPILGMRVERTYDVEVTCIEASGETRTVGLVWTTEGPPSPFPEIDVSAFDPEKMEPGYTLFNASPTASIDYVFVLDDALELVWYSRQQAPHYLGVTLTPDAYLMGNIYPAVHVMDFLGEPVRSFTPWVEDVWDIQTDFPFHHESVPMASGGALALTSQARVVEGFPLDYGFTQTGDVSVVDDAIIEIGPDGGIETLLWVGDLIDPHRVAYGSYDDTGDHPGSIDWTHANAALVDPADGGYLVSLRHQDAVVKVSRDGQLQWILGNHEGWGAAWQPYLLDPVGPLTWSFHQHAPAFTPEGDLVMFDNGNYRSTPYNPQTNPEPSYSRVVSYRIDPVAMTVEQRWEYRRTVLGELYSPAMGDADPQPTTGNVLATYGRGKTVDGRVNATWNRGETVAHLVEFHPDTPETPALHLSLYSHLDEMPGGWGVYRADRIAGFYPWELDAAP